jgi:hypothetical protein
MMIPCQVLLVNRLRDWKTGRRPVAISVAAVYNRRTGQRLVFRNRYQLFRAGERVLFRRSFGQRVIV